MNFSKPAYRIIRERLLHWYLFTPQSISISLEQLSDLLVELEKPLRLGHGPGSKKAQIGQLYEYLLLFHKAKIEGQLPPTWLGNS